MAAVMAGPAFQMSTPSTMKKAIDPQTTSLVSLDRNHPLGASEASSSRCDMSSPEYEPTEVSSGCRPG